MVYDGYARRYIVGSLPLYGSSPAPSRPRFFKNFSAGTRPGFGTCGISPLCYTVVIS